MRYFDVKAVNADGSPNTLHFTHVSQWSLTGMTGFFAENGVVLQPTYRYSIDDRPIYRRDPDTEEYLPNTGQVI